jgi:hypothetical protein
MPCHGSGCKVKMELGAVCAGGTPRSSNSCAVLVGNTQRGAGIFGCVIIILFRSSFFLPWAWSFFPPSFPTKIILPTSKLSPTGWRRTCIIHSFIHRCCRIGVLHLNFIYNSALDCFILTLITKHYEYYIYNIANTVVAFIPINVEDANTLV